MTDQTEILHKLAVSSRLITRGVAKGHVVIDLMPSVAGEFVAALEQAGVKVPYWIQSVPRPKPASEQKPLFASQCVGRKKDNSFCGAVFKGETRADQWAQLEAHIRAEHSDCPWMMDSLTHPPDMEVG